MPKMTPKQRALYDAQADHEAWGLAHEILDPLVQATRPIGSSELTQVMEKALAEVEGEVNRTIDVLEGCQGEAEPGSAVEVLGTVNAKLGGAINLLDNVPPEAFGDRDRYFRAKQAIAEAGQLVATAEIHQEAREDRPAE